MGVVSLLATVVAVAGAAPAVQAGPVIDGLAERLVTVRPDVGPTWVLDLPGGTADRILARTLQGVVNRTEARVFVREPADEGAQHWLDVYQAEGLITVAGTTDLSGALDRFASEASGFVVADLAEPWTVQAAATIAADEGGVVAFPEHVADLEGRGLTQIDDLRGRWTDAVTAYRETFDARRAGMASSAIAVLSSSARSFDFAVQQGIPAVYTRPSHDTWEGVRELLLETGPGNPVYGYLSDDGDEEVIAVATLSAADLTLIPTDTSSNLSFHVAVAKDQARVRAPARDLSGVAPCRAEDVNVVVGITDGDNLQVPLRHLVAGGNWTSPRRGDLPVGWSISPALSVLAPGVWDAYAREATPNDELVAMAGWGYGAPALAPGALEYYEVSFGLMDELGMSTFWSLGGGLETGNAPSWTEVDTAAGEVGVPDLVLAGYGNGVGDQFWSPAGLPALTSRSVYSETPADLAGYVVDQLATPPEDRPLVTFLAATNWTNSMAALADALLPLEADGVRYLTPAEAAACLPEPPPPEPPVEPGARACAPDGPVTRRGLALITAPAEAEITAHPTSFGLPTTVEATSAVEVGDRIDYEAVITVDVPGFAADTLADRVQPVIAAGYSQGLADTAWVTMAFDGLQTTMAVPAGTTPTGTPAVTSTGPDATAAWGADGLVVRTAAFVEDTRTPGQPFELHVAWSVAVGEAAGATDVVLSPSPVTFDLDLGIGVLLGTTPLSGTVSASWACLPDDVALASTAVAAAAPATTTTTTTSAPAPTTTTTAATVSTGAVTAPRAVAVRVAPRYAG